MAGFATLKPKKKGSAMHGKAPTVSDKAQSVVHHVDSVKYNLGHAVTHLQQAQEHAQAINTGMLNSSELSPHLQALQQAMGGFAAPSKPSLPSLNPSAAALMP